MNTTERLKDVLFKAEQEAKSMSCNYVGTEHILLGIMKNGQGVANAVLRHLGVLNSYEEVRDETAKILGVQICKHCGKA